MTDEDWMMRAAEVAKRALCLNAKCGAVIVKNGEVIGEGYNAPPQDDLELRTCEEEFPGERKRKFDRTCCMHAEWRAILDALRKSPKEVPGSILYFVRVDEEGKPKRSGEPYCTVCSRFALDTGISHFGLWHEGGIRLYPTEEYNRLSYDYHRAR